MKIRTLGSSSPVSSDQETLGQSRERICPGSHSKSGSSLLWNRMESY